MAPLSRKNVNPADLSLASKLSSSDIVHCRALAADDHSSCSTRSADASAALSHSAVGGATTVVKLGNKSKRVGFGRGVPSS